MSLDVAATAPDAPEQARPNPWGALDYQAPFVIEKLVKDHVAANEQEAELLFREAMRYLVLSELDRTLVWKMYSMRVDEAWHQFILYTVKYAEFCREYFDRYLHHSPGNAPKVDSAESIRESTFAEFSERYADLFGQPLPRVWFDERTVTIERRLFSDHAGKLTLVDDRDMVDVLNPRGSVVFGAGALAREALEFITRTGVFHVRELPGELTDEEKVGLATALVECKILRVGG